MVRGHQQLPLSPYVPPRHTRGVLVGRFDFLDV